MENGGFRRWRLEIGGETENLLLRCREQEHGGNSGGERRRPMEESDRQFQRGKGSRSLFRERENGSRFEREGKGSRFRLQNRVKTGSKLGQNGSIAKLGFRWEIAESGSARDSTILRSKSPISSDPTFQRVCKRFRSGRASEIVESYDPTIQLAILSTLLLGTGKTRNKSKSNQP